MIKEGGLFRTDTLHFYIKSHTKIDYDHAFNSLKVLYWNQNVFIFEKCCENLNTRNYVEIIKRFHWNFFDLESFLNNIQEISDPKTFNINNVFWVKEDSSHIGYSQELHSNSESKQNYNKENAYIIAHRKRKIRNIFKHRSQLEKQNIRVENRVTLAKFRFFVVPED